MRIRTVAARRTDPPPLVQGSGPRAPDRALVRLRQVRRASARRRRVVRVPAAFGRWRCRWSTLPLRVSGTGPPRSRCRPSPAASWFVRSLDARGAIAAVSLPGTIASRPGRMRSSGTCSGSGTPRARRVMRARSSSLVVGLAPVMGWGTVPASGSERAGSCARTARAFSGGWTTCKSLAWSRTNPSATGPGAGGAHRSCCWPRLTRQRRSCGSPRSAPGDGGRANSHVSASFAGSRRVLLPRRGCRVSPERRGPGWARGTTMLEGGRDRHLAGTGSRLRV